MRSALLKKLKGRRVDDGIKKSQKDWEKKFDESDWPCEDSTRQGAEESDGQKLGSESDLEDDIQKRADCFIQNFHRQLRLERKSSLERHLHGVLSDETIRSKSEASLEIMKEQVNQREDASSNNRWSPCIFKSPFPGLGFQEPELVAIGPYHWGKDLPLEKYKYSFLQKFLSRRRAEGKDLCFYVGQIMTLEWPIRRCYSEDLSMASPDFVEMILVDACFVMEVLRHFGRTADLEDGDFRFPVEPWQIPILVRDLLIVENQIPFFVLEKLSELASDDESEDGTATVSVIAMAVKFFDLAFPCSLDIKSKFNSLEVPKHLLDLFMETIRPSNPSTNSPYLFLKAYQFMSTAISHFCLLVNYAVRRKPALVSKSKTRATSSNQNDPKPSSTLKTAKAGGNAGNLRMSGIELRPRRRDRLTDIHFKNGVLEIPPITISDFFMAILVNCVAFEHFCAGLGCSKDLTAYACFMSGLIRYPADLECLSSDGIMSRFSDQNEKVLSFFHNLRSEIADININVQDCYLHRTAMEIDKCCSSKRVGVTLMRYFWRYWNIVLFCITSLWFNFWFWPESTTAELTTGVIIIKEDMISLLPFCLGLIKDLVAGITYVVALYWLAGIMHRFCKG